MNNSPSGKNNTTKYAFCCIVYSLYSVFVIAIVHFFLFDCDAKRKKRTQRKRKHAIFLRPSGV